MQEDSKEPELKAKSALREAFEDKFPEENSQLVDIKADLMNHGMKKKMNEKVGNKMGFYQALNKKVTPEYRVMGQQEPI